LLISLSVAWAGPTSTLFDAEEVNRLTAGEVASLEDVRTGSPSGWGKVERKLTRDWRTPALVGDYSLTRLSTPPSSYFIRVLPLSRETFKVQIGFRVINQVIQFEPRGYVASHLEDNFPKETTANNPIFYVSEDFIGGQRMEEISFQQSDSSHPIPNELSLFFDASDEGEAHFTSQLSKLLLEYHQIYHQQLSWKSYESPPVHQEVVAEPDEKNISKKSSSLLKGLFKRKEKGVGEKEHKDSLFQSESYLKVLKQYGKAFLAANIPGNSQYVLADPYPIKSGTEYQPIHQDMLLSLVPELIALTEKYTVDGYLANDPDSDKVRCRIHVYPNERNGYHQVRVSHITWVHGEATAHDLKAAASEALFKIANTLRLE
jgi:hypothetical protein